MGKAKDWTGYKIGRLTVVESIGKNEKGKIQWLCKCSCGGTKILTSTNLYARSSKSCGCLAKEHQKGQGGIQSEFKNISNVLKTDMTPEEKIAHIEIIVQRYENHALKQKEEKLKKEGIYPIRYIGLQDCDGNKIYTGDIVDYLGYRLQVIYSEEYKCFCFQKLGILIKLNENRIVTKQLELKRVKRCPERMLYR